MFIGHQDEFTRAKLLRRVGNVLQHSAAGNGTPSAEIVADALLADAGISGVGPRRIGELSDDAVLATLVDVVGGVNEGGRREFMLPFGTPGEIERPGGLRIGNENYVTDAARPGLHRMETVRRDAHGPNLRLLRDLIARRTRKLACRRIGLPSPKLVVGDDARELLQFEPFAEAGGVALQRGAHETGAERFCAATPKQISAFADDIVADMRTLWSRRDAIAGRVEAVRTSAEAGAAAFRAAGERSRVTLVAIDVSRQRGDDHFAIEVEYDALDEALRPGRVICHVPWNWLPEHGPLFPRRAKFRKEDAAELSELGADGRIDALAKGLADKTPGGTSAVLALLAEEYSAFFSIPTSAGPMFVTYYWDDGVINADVTLAGRIEAYGTTLELTNCRSSSGTAELVGQALDAAFDLPFACGSQIIDASELMDGSVRVEVEPMRHLADCATGRIWTSHD